MTTPDSDPSPSGATLRFEGGPTVWISGERQLRDAIEALWSVRDGRCVTLERGPKHHVKAKRRGEFWSVTLRNGGWWTVRGFTADFTTEFSERETRRSKESTTFLARFTGRTGGETALSNSQVESIFVAWLLGTKFSVPVAGA